MSEIDKKKLSAPESQSGSTSPIETYRDDLYKERKETLGNYLKSQTSGEQYEVPDNGNQILRKEHKNAFNISNTETSEFSIIDDEGKPAGIQNSQNSQPSFSNQTELEESFNDAYQFFDNLSKGRMENKMGGGSFLNEDMSELGIDKNAQEAGHSILNKPSGIADKVVSSVLQRNRWTPYQNPDSPESERRYDSMGQYNVDLRNPRQNLNEFEADTDNLKNIGRSLLLAASSESSVDSPVDVREQNFAVGDFDLLGFLQNSIPNMLGTPERDSGNIDYANSKIEIDRFNALNHKIDLENSAVNRGKEKKYNATSFGVLNNHIRQFEDQPGRLDMVQLSFLSLVAMITSSIFTLLIVEIVSSGTNALTNISYGNNSSRGLGSRVLPSGNSVQKHTRGNGGWAGVQDEALKIIQNLPQSFVEYLGIYQPMHITGAGGFASYSAAVGMGIISLLYAMVKDFGFSSGFFASTFRTVMRSEFLGDDLLDAPDSSQANFASIIGYFRKLRESRALASLNYLAKLGDIFYASYARDSSYAVRLAGSAGEKLKEAKDLKNSRNHHASKGANGFNWAIKYHSTIEKIHSSDFEDQAYKYFTTEIAGLTADAVKYYAIADITETNQNDKPTRLSAEEVRKIEQNLEAEYMPFYFQDLRTNEIVAFHAFLTSLSDGFTANYNSTKGFGRMDPVMTYGDTSRSLGLNFIVFATSKEDFDLMYKKINKMVTMVYPQWSGGTKVMSADEKNSYTIPFSQIPTASPLIRMRVGDLIKSNYSRKDMTRLFGTSDETFTIDEISFGGLYNSIWERKKRKEAKKNFQAWANSLFNEKGTYKPEPPPHKPYGNPISFRWASGQKFWMINLEPSVWWKDESAVKDIKIKENIMASRIRLISFERIYDDQGRILGQDWEMFDIDELKKFNEGLFKEAIEEGESEVVARSAATTPGLSILYDFAYNLRETVPDFFMKFDIPDDDAWIANHFFCRPKAAAKQAILEYYQKAIDAAAIDRLVSEEEETTQEQLAILETAEAWKKSINEGRALILVGRDNVLGQVMWVEDGFITEEWLKANKNSQEAPSVQQKLEASKKFFDPENNPILKAFESTAGKGMPGVITQLGLDWKLNEYPWELDPGNKAPMGCEITIQFQPMHEIAPGLDKNGINRAPVFRVGSSGKEE